MYPLLRESKVMLFYFLSPIIVLIFLCICRQLYQSLVVLLSGAALQVNPSTSSGGYDLTCIIVDSSLSFILCLDVLFPAQWRQISVHTFLSLAPHREVYELPFLFGDKDRIGTYASQDNKKPFLCHAMCHLVPLWVFFFFFRGRNRDIELDAIRWPRSFGYG